MLWKQERTFFFALAKESAEIHFHPFTYSTLICGVVRPCPHFLVCSDHCANLKVGVALTYPGLMQFVLSSRFLLKELLLLDGMLSKHILTHQEEHRIAWDLLLFFEDEELTSLNGHTMSSRV